VLLVRNLETVLDAVQQVLGLGPLTSKPSPLRATASCCASPTGAPRTSGSTLLQRVPSLAYLVDKLARAIVELGL
jgi:hypothetical protein